MIVVGLTGSIAMGKSETAKLFAQAGVPVFDSDAAVHELYAPGGAAVGPVGALVPAAVITGAVDRSILSRHLQEHPQDFAKVESIVHPLVRQRQQDFLAAHRAAGSEMVLLDIPLLFESRREADVDVIVVVSATAGVQRARALARPGMSAAKFEAILARQLPDAEKRARAHHVIDTSQSLADAALQVQDVLRKIKAGQRHA